MTTKQKKQAEQAVKIMRLRIKKGIAFLDKRFGRSKWLPRINESVLKLSSGTSCVAGQLFDGYWNGLLYELVAKKLHISIKKAQHLESTNYEKYDKAEDFALDVAHTYGFTLDADDDGIENDNPYLNYDNLTRLWFNEISAMKIVAGIKLETPPPIE